MALPPAARSFRAELSSSHAVFPANTRASDVRSVGKVAYAPGVPFKKIEEKKDRLVFGIVPKKPEWKTTLWSVGRNAPIEVTSRGWRKAWSSRSEPFGVERTRLRPFLLDARGEVGGGER